MTDHDLQTLSLLDPVDVDELRRQPPPPVPVRFWLEPDPSPVRGGWRRRPLRVAGGVVAVAAVVAIGVNLLSGAADRSSPAAVQALESVAGIASAQAGAEVPPEFVYSRVTSSTLVTSDPAPGYSYLLPTTTETWIAQDGSGRVRERVDAPTFVGPRDRRRWIANGSPTLTEQPPGTVHDQVLGVHDLDGVTPGAEGLPPTYLLPTNPEALRTALRRVASQSEVPVDVKTFELASAVLMQAGSSPELRSALFRVVSTIPGVVLRGEVTDPRGRRGTGVSITSDYSGAAQRDTLIFDAETSQPLASVTTLDEPQPWIDGTELGSVVLDTSSGTESARVRP